MENASKDLVQKRLAELPDDVRNAILSSDFNTQVQQIGGKNNLHVDQIGALGDETMLVMLGFSDPEEFTDILRDQLHVSGEVAVQIAADITKQLFLPIRESMKQFIEEREAEQSAATITQATSPTTSELATSTISPAAPTTQTQVQQATPNKVVMELPTAEKLLTQTTITTAQPTVTPIPPTSGGPAKPISKADPYREPV